MRQFGYTQIIPRHPVVSAPPAMTHRDMDAMFDDYLSHLVAPGDPLRPSHQEILEDEHSQLDHPHDVLSRCRCIVEIVQAGIYRGVFPNGFELR
ncbi:unnamed protein product [Lathyrus oleraceus]